MKHVTATASGASIGMGPEKTIDGSGLNGKDEHSTDPMQMWLTSKTGLQPVWIQYAFDKVYRLDKLWVWNSNQVMESMLGFGAKNVTVEYSTDGTTWAKLGDFVFAQASATATYTANTTVNFAGATAKYVKLTINGNWGRPGAAVRPERGSVLLRADPAKGGSQVGYDAAPFAERTIIHSGRQSMPVEYNNVNSPFYSEAQRECSSVQNWTGNGADSLSLWVRGLPANSPADLYVTVQDGAGKTATAANPTAVTSSAWTQWKIPLSSLAGVNMSKVKKLSLGVGSRVNPAKGGAGKLYLDDIGYGRSLP